MQRVRHMLATLVAFGAIASTAQAQPDPKTIEPKAGETQSADTGLTTKASDGPARISTNLTVGKQSNIRGIGPKPDDPRTANPAPAPNETAIVKSKSNITNN